MTVWGIEYDVAGKMSLENIKQEYTLILTAHDMEEMQNKICMEINQHLDQQLKDIKKNINEQISEKMKEQYDKLSQDMKEYFDQKMERLESQYEQVIDKLVNENTKQQKVINESPKSRTSHPTIGQHNVFPVRTMVQIDSSNPDLNLARVLVSKPLEGRKHVNNDSYEASDNHAPLPGKSKPT